MATVTIQTPIDPHAARSGDGSPTTEASAVSTAAHQVL
jgi:hypothetical protein